MEQFDYSGSELEIFAAATNWKAYWSREIGAYLGENVLEIGSGIGSTARTLAHKKYKKWVGLEPDRRLCELMLAEKQNGNLSEAVEIRNGTSFDLHDDDVFDTVLYIDVLEHIEDDGAELARIERHLDEGGNIIIVAPAHNFLYSAFDKKIGHFRRYNKKMLRSIIPAGMIVRKLYYLDSVGLLASLANRLLLRSDTPTHTQIQVWDKYMVVASRWIDKWHANRVGKSLICVLHKSSDSARAVK